MQHKVWRGGGLPVRRAEADLTVMDPWPFDRQRDASTHKTLQIVYLQNEGTDSVDYLVVPPNSCLHSVKRHPEGP